MGKEALMLGLTLNLALNLPCFISYLSHCPFPTASSGAGEVLAGGSVARASSRGGKRG